MSEDMKALPPIPNPPHTSGGADPRRPYVLRHEGGGGKVVAPFFSDDEMHTILDPIAGRAVAIQKLAQIRSLCLSSEGHVFDLILALVEEGAAALTRPAPSSMPTEAFQQRVGAWMEQCFTPEIIADKLERADRFIEEALELVQATGYSAERAHALVDYVFGRPVGDPFQEAGGVKVTLAALCNPHGIDMDAAAETELARVWTKIETIRAKQATKPVGSALPIPQPSSIDERLAETLKPFADAYEDHGDGEAFEDRTNIWEHPAALEITLGDLRRARTALGSPSPEEAK